MEKLIKSSKPYPGAVPEESGDIALSVADQPFSRESTAMAIQRLIARVEELPSLPIVTAEILECLENPDTPASALANLISTDQSLAARLLRLANSAYYGFPRRIGTINLAVVVLGFDTVRDLCLSLLITDSVFRASESMPLDVDAAWRHSIATAIASRMLLRSSGANVPGEGFVAGLVHDVGKLFLARYFPTEYSCAVERTKKEGISLREAESQVFGLTHAVVGGWLLDEWNLPVWLVDSTRDHHGADAGDDWGLLAQNTGFADALVRQAGYEAGPGDPLEASPQIITNLRLKKNEAGQVDLPYYMDKLQQEILKAGDFIKALRSGPEAETHAAK